MHTSIIIVIRHCNRFHWNQKSFSKPKNWFSTTCKSFNFDTKTVHIIILQ